MPEDVPPAPVDFDTGRPMYSPMPLRGPRPGEAIALDARSEPVVPPAAPAVTEGKPSRRSEDAGGSTPVPPEQRCRPNLLAGPGNPHGLGLDEALRQLVAEVGAGLAFDPAVPVQDEIRRVEVLVQVVDDLEHARKRLQELPTRAISKAGAA